VIPPLPNSYWALQGRLLAGEHPAGKDDVATRRRVDLLLASGVRSFIDLTCVGEMPPYVALLPDTATYRNLPIPDHCVPQAPARMREIIRAVETALAGEDAVYVHCRAGIGRTGMAIGCWLRERGNAPDAALQALNRLWRQNARSVRWPTIPETAAQEQYVLGWQVEARHGVCT
jgi:Swiss Army Knife protein, DSP-PTPase phosphatase domain